MDELRQLADDLAGKNVVGLKELRSFVGKCQAIASLLYTWRPFVHMFYAALHSVISGAPDGCCWGKQIAVPLSWVRAFMRQSPGELERRFTLDAYLRQGPKLVITTDASP